MSFRFYITDLNEGLIRGTDDEKMAKEFAECEDYFVVDTENNLWLQVGNKSNEIEEMISVENEDD